MDRFQVVSGLFGVGMFVLMVIVIITEFLAI